MPRPPLLTTGPARCTPLTAATEVERVSEDTVVTSTTIGPEEPLLAGHYPGFPIVPGVCLIECAHRAVLVAAAGRAPRLDLAAIESTRFLSPVFPGDRVETEVRIERSEATWRCRASVKTGRGTAAEVRLRYVQGDAG
jgi:3-hydroxyacyl-[acyl-carrier-protein] dehydratase